MKQQWRIFSVKARGGENEIMKMKKMWRKPGGGNGIHRKRRYQHRKAIVASAAWRKWRNNKIWRRKYEKRIWLCENERLKYGENNEISK
jgi:hypothetical protein